MQLAGGGRDAVSFSLPSAKSEEWKGQGGCRGAKQNWVTGASFTLRGHS